MLNKIKAFYKKDKNVISSSFLTEYELEVDLRNHLVKTSKYAEMLADLMCLDSEKVKKIKKGALFHDVGKKMIEKQILNSPDKLTFEEFEIMKEHSKLGLRVLNKKHKEEIVENIILFHHEKWNGNGYPFGLAKTFIPLEARIVSVADCYDALTTKRVYKNEVSHEEALKILKNESGTSFDPDIISIFEIFENKFKQVLESFNECKKIKKEI
ncbi:MAG: HD-GYP domain-containing protein [Cetobacterium sp.]|uniref:HD-GYP domain-containing protein n=1 Tax=Cetobacterium sp. TaxID=2071632 RepID=UPI003F39982A